MTPAQTPERPVTWSEQELRKAWDANALLPTWLDTVRAVLKALGAAHPAEVRERERSAFRKGARVQYDAPPAVLVTEHADYPSLAPPSPPPLVLDSGTRIERTGSGGYTVHPCMTGIEHTNIPLASLGRYCTTEQDFTAIAKWLQENRN